MPVEHSRLSWLGWAAYLACSWTWCIGMFLPVLLIKDYGWTGFALFAAPNIIGAAAMGWTVRGEEHSRALIAAHRPMMLAFSWVTRMYQYFFAVYAASVAAQAMEFRGPGAKGWPAWILAAGAFFVAAICVTGSARIGRLLTASVVAWLLSAALLAGAGLNGAFGRDDFWGATPASATPADLSGVLAVCAFGFGLCPYLDLTFHRAAQTRGRRGSFGVGFGVLFAAMIAGTALYSFAAYWSPLMPPERRLAMTLVFVHLCVQMGFTASAHSAESRNVLEASGQRRYAPVLAASSAVAGIAAGLLVSFWGAMKLPEVKIGDLPLPIIVYKTILGAYGLAFPAYVWICMAPTWRKPSAPTRRMLGVWIGACIVAAPAMVIGFLWLNEKWMTAGVLVMLAARFLAGGQAPAAGGSEDSR